MKKQFLAAATAAMTLVSLAGCGSAQSTNNAVKLDPSNPVSLTVWHYYNGAQQAAFDALVSEFNASVGKDEGIYVESYSQGSVSDLEAAITDSASGKVGSSPLPDIFSTYADTAYAVEQQGLLADISQYFTKEEQSEYVDSYVQEGYFGNDGAMYLFPVAKSTEIMMLDKTDWEPFAAATGSTLDELKTLEGVVTVAKRYYEWTDAQTPDVPDDGKAFYGRDSMSNYFIIGMKQLGTEIFSVEDGNVTLNVDRDKIRRLWDNYYVPYVSGYFASAGKFRSDDVKTGEIIAYTGSSSSSMYFPNQVVTGDNEQHDIECEVLPIPVLEGGENINVQQGASMAITKSDAQHEYAAVEFLKWFTAKENNLRFVCESAYLPVRKESNTVEALDEVIAAQNIDINTKAYDCLKSIMENFNDTTFYTPKCFSNGYKTRSVLDYNLSDKAVADKQAIQEAVDAGTPRAEAVAPYITDEAFDAWYTAFCEKLEATAAGQN